jgi:hypothetical protein
MTDEDRRLIRELIDAMRELAQSIQNLPRSITMYDADYRPPGGGGGGGGAGAHGH